MNYYENVVMEYLRADRSLFVNTECCIQINEADNPDQSGPHWYCDMVAASFRDQTVYLCEVSYSNSLDSLFKRLTAWQTNWDGVCAGLRRDCRLPSEWPVRPWLFVPEHLVERVVITVKKLQQSCGIAVYLPNPRITTLEMIQPWLYNLHNRKGEAQKPATVPDEMKM